MSEKPISPLRQRMLEDMTVRKFGAATQRNYIRAVKTLSEFLGRSPASATAEDLRRFQVHQRPAPPTIGKAIVVQSRQTGSSELTCHARLLSESLLR